MRAREAFIAGLHVEEPRIENWALSNIAAAYRGKRLAAFMAPA